MPGRSQGAGTVRKAGVCVRGGCPRPTWRASPAGTATRQPARRPVRYVRGGAGVAEWWGAGLLTSGLNHVVRAGPGWAGDTRLLLRRRDLGGAVEAASGRAGTVRPDHPSMARERLPVLPWNANKLVYVAESGGWCEAWRGVRRWGQPVGSTLSSALLTKSVGSFLFPARAWLRAAATIAAAISYLCVMA